MLFVENCVRVRVKTIWEKTLKLMLKKQNSRKKHMLKEQNLFKEIRIEQINK